VSAAERETRAYDRPAGAMNPAAADGGISAKRVPGSPLEVLHIFLRLGLTSFGGPIAHLGYFREEFVVRRKWLDEQSFVDLVALCQFLPGPASSQVGFSIGLMRGGYLGALAARTGFTTLGIHDLSKFTPT
jgi:chromate transporter